VYKTIHKKDYYLRDDDFVAKDKLRQFARLLARRLWYRRRWREHRWETLQQIN